MVCLKVRKLLKLTESGKLFHTLITLQEKKYTLMYDLLQTGFHVVSCGRFLAKFHAISLKSDQLHCLYRQSPRRRFT